MSRIVRTPVLRLLFTLGVLHSAAQGRAELNAPYDLDLIEELCRPSQSESGWESIPWMTDLWQARALAARVGKPILLWEMDGHPLGCT